MAPLRWEDGTSGRPLGDDEDLDYAEPYVEAEPEWGWADLSPEQRAAATRRAQR